MARETPEPRLREAVDDFIRWWDANFVETYAHVEDLRDAVRAATPDPAEPNERSRPMTDRTAILATLGERITAAERDIAATLQSNPHFLRTDLGMYTANVRATARRDALIEARGLIECVNKHDEGGNCLDDDRSIVGWRDEVNATPDPAEPGLLRAALTALETEAALHPYPADVPVSVVAVMERLRAALARSEDPT